MSSDNPLTPRSETLSETPSPDASTSDESPSDESSSATSTPETTGTETPVSEPSVTEPEAGGASTPTETASAVSDSDSAVASTTPESSPEVPVTTPPTEAASGETLADSTTDLPADAQPIADPAAAPEAAAISTDNAVSETLNENLAPEGVPTDSPAVESAETVASETVVPAAPADTDTPADKTVVGDQAAETFLEEATESRPKPKLNPTGSGDSRAVPTYAGSDGPKETGPVEVPRDADIDADLEAQISQAMAGETAAPPTPAPVATDTAAGTEDGKPAEKVVAPLPEAPTEDLLEEGSRLNGRVQSIHGEDIFLDVGYRSPGIAQVRQFGGKAPAVDDVIEVVVTRFDQNEGLLHVSAPRGPQKVSSDWDQLAKNQVVDVTVNKSNKGGLEVQVGSLRGFMPASQVDIRYVENLDSYVGQKLRAVITEVNPRRKNLVVSRRAYLAIEREEAEQMLWTKLAEGQTFTGIVRSLKPYGAFVDIGGVDAFLHVSDISWTRINKPADVLSEGQEIEVKVLKLDREAKKIGLGMKQLEQNPWSNIEEKYPKGETVTGKVTKVTEFGAFVELEPAVEGLCHISELAYRRVHKVTEVVRVGESYEFKITDVIPQKRRISLSYKQTQPAPERPQHNRRNKEDEIPDTERYERKHKGPLSGGIGENKSGGGLFGNPNDFGS